MPLEILSNKKSNQPTIIYGIRSGDPYEVVPNTWTICKDCPSHPNIKCANLKVTARNTITGRISYPCVSKYYMEGG